MTPLATVAFHTLGCKLNYTETQAISKQFTEAGYEKIDFDAGADYCIINTCSVTQNADKECKSLINKAKRLNPDATIVIIGCYAQLQPETIAAFKGVDLVLGAQEKFNIIQHLKSLENHSPQKIYNQPIEKIDFYTPAYSFGDRTRAFLKVQDGCDYSCTFCTIPLARGKSRSPEVSFIVQEAEQLARAGAKEIVLTGVNIGDFGKANNEKNSINQNFLSLIQSLDKVENIARFRISSIEPNLLHQEIIDLVATSKRFAPHFHIPLQSGSDDVLKKMKRRYLSALYAEKVNYIKSVMPHACIGVDVIVGFPGETPQDFQKTYDFLDALPVSYFHVFTYSERPNTPAVHYPNSVPNAERKLRNQQLQQLSEKKKAAFYAAHLNTTRPVLFEVENKDGMMYGFSDNYIKVAHTYDAAWANKIIPVQLQSIDESGIVQARTTNQIHSPLV